MHYSTVGCEKFSNKEKVAVFVPATNVAETGYQAMLYLGFSSLLVSR